MGRMLWGQSMGSADEQIRDVAVFDYDGTVIDGQSGWLISLYLYKRGFVSLWRATRLVWWGLRYKLHLPHREEEARELVLGAVSHMSADEVDQIMRDFHDEVLIPLYREQAVEEIRRRNAEGCATLLLSATFQQIADRAADYLSMTGAVATQLERDENGNYTGHVSGDVVEGDEKPIAACRWADERYGKGNWRLAYAYGDHRSDAKLLDLADEAFAVCPKKTLKPLAKRGGWTVLDWEEDSVGGNDAEQ